MILEESYSEPFVDEFLEHFGVKGMKWGVRRNKKGPIKKFKDNRAAKKAERIKRYQEGLKAVKEYAAKNPKSLIAVQENYVTTIMTGKEYTQMAMTAYGQTKIQSFNSISILAGPPQKA